MQNSTSEELEVFIEQCQSDLTETAIKLAAAVAELERRGQ
jgi:hypothetical protein